MADESEFELAMPFLPVVSRGGPFDDMAFTAGWAMGALYWYLGYGRPAIHADTIRTTCREQADLIAMKYGYTATFEDSEVEGWTYMALTKGAADA